MIDNLNVTVMVMVRARQSLSFSHVDVGDAFQIINHTSTCEQDKALAGGEPPLPCDI